jgi:diguanylate cyclase (GGDEF)-like protein
MKEFRSWDLVARWGGEEFVAFMPGATREEALAVTEAVRSCVADHDWSGLIGDHQVTVSIGITSFEGHGEGNVQQVLEAAGQNLRRAKQAGKNRVVTD